MLEMETAVQNTGEQDLPFGFGIHPYFRLPETGTIKVPAQQRWELVDNLPTGILLDIEGGYDLRQPRNLDGLNLDDIFTCLIPDADGLVQCIIDDEQKEIKTIVEFDTRQFPNVVLYTPPAPRRAICIEPYTCPTNVFNLHDQGIDCNLMLLQPHEAANYKLCIYINGCYK